MNLYNTPMLPGPFDDSATARQTRMGLLQSDGSPEQDAVSVLARVYAGLLFDDLCETLNCSRLKSDLEKYNHMVYPLCKQKVTGIRPSMRLA